MNQHNPGYCRFVFSKLSKFDTKYIFNIVTIFPGSEIDSSRFLVPKTLLLKELKAKTPQKLSLLLLSCKQPLNMDTDFNFLYNILISLCFLDTQR